MAGLNDNAGFNWAVLDWLKPDCYGTTKNQISMKIGTVTLYFSFKTIIGFSQYHGEVTLTPNQWGRDTGRHLNNIKALKEISVVCESREEFELLLKHALFRAATDLSVDLVSLPVNPEHPTRIEI